MKAVFESGKTFSLFTNSFDKELYHYAETYYDTHVFGRSRLMYAVTGVAKVLEDVEISQRNYKPYQDVKRFLEQDFVKIHNDTQIIDKFKPYLTARIDIVFQSKSDESDFKIISISDEKVKIYPPNRLNTSTIAYQIHSYSGELKIVTKSTADGKISIWLRGIDVRTPEDKSKRLPYWIDYTKLHVNDKTIFETLTPAWCSKSYTYSTNTKAGEEIKIQVEWQPHRSDT